MDRRIAAVGAVVLLLGSVVVVQILDPRLGERSPPEVDFSEPPNEVAADAAKQFEYVDYEYRIEIANEKGGEWEQVRVVRVDHSNHEYYKVGPLGERGVVIYGNDAITFVRPEQGAEWRVTIIPQTAYPAPMLTQPLDVNAIQNTEVSSAFANGTHSIYTMKTNVLKMLRGYPGSSKIAINRESGSVDWVIVRYNMSKSESRYVRLKVTESEVSVDRPNEIAFSSKEGILDVLRGPIFSMI